jgi:hypothetical protein
MVGDDGKIMRWGLQTSEALVGHLKNFGFYFK